MLCHNQFGWDELVRVLSRTNYFQKMGGCQNPKHTNRDIKFSKSQNDW